MAFKATSVIFLLSLFFGFTPTVSTAAGCNVESYTGVNGPAHIYVTGSCSTSQAASDACLAFAHSHNYNYSLCNHANYTPTWNAGWLCGSGNGGGYCLPPDTNFYLGNFYYYRYYVSTEDIPAANCDNCNGVGDPVNPSSGATYQVLDDLSRSGVVGLTRYYNSRGSGAPWKYSYSRSISALYQSVVYQPYSNNNPKYSAYYNSPSEACSTGFSSIRSKVANWQSATAAYSNGACLLSNSGVSVGALRLRAFLTSPGDEGYLSDVGAKAISLGLPAESTTPVLFDVIRDDGQIIRFYINAGVITAPPGYGLKLVQTGNGYTLSDGNDNVETYDVAGRLLLISSRTGVVKTMNYDISGRLGSVVDSFGHQLIFGYDAQSRLISVTQQ